MQDLINKKRLKWEIEKWYEKEYYSSFNAAVYKALIKIIDKVPSVESEKRTEERTETRACDCISRQAVNKLVDELARAISDEKCHIQRGRNYGRIMHDILELPSVEYETDEDCINRKDMIKKLNNLCNNICEYSKKQRKSMCDACNLSLVFDMINNAKSIEPERKTGKWEYVQYDGNPKIGNWHCSNCRVIVNSGFEGTPVFNYCPICGTKMEVNR